jgi:hypothetical protein
LIDNRARYLTVPRIEEDVGLTDFVKPQSAVGAEGEGDAIPIAPLGTRFDRWDINLNVPDAHQRLLEDAAFRLALSGRR